MPKSSPHQPIGWHSRGYLPHFDGGTIPQFVTFRLSDSLPQCVLETWRKEFSSEPNLNVDVALRKRIEVYLDHGHGECLLRTPRIAELVQDSLLFFDGERYRLTAWVIMPNHVHILATPCAGYELSAILHSLKSYTANEANKIAGRTGQLWQRESFDRWIRNADHFANAIIYIENNPVKAGLCERPEDWRFSSAAFRKRER